MDAAGPGAASDGARPALSGAVAQRALFSLQEAVEVVLQFIEQTACEEEEERAAAAAAAASGSGGGSAAAAPRRPLLLAALRALARCACTRRGAGWRGRIRLQIPCSRSIGLRSLAP